MRLPFQVVRRPMPALTSRLSPQGKYLQRWHLVLAAFRFHVFALLLQSRRSRQFPVQTLPERWLQSIARKHQAALRLPFAYRAGFFGFESGSRPVGLAARDATGATRSGSR